MQRSVNIDRISTIRHGDIGDRPRHEKNRGHETGDSKLHRVLSVAPYASPCIYGSGYTRGHFHFT